MRNSVLFCLFFSISIVSFGQWGNNGPTLEIVGTSKISVKPDVGTLIISISTKNLSFSETITGLNQKTKDISSQITKKIGFKESEIKTTDFEINKNTIYRRGESIDSGYVATQSIKVDFKNDSETITKILNTFSKSQTDFSLSFNFKLSDELKEKVQTEILKLAIKDSKDKAKLISESSGVKLKKIKTINYGNNYQAGMEEVRDRTMEKVSASTAESSGPLIGFTPNDLHFFESVLITWKIK